MPLMHSGTLVNRPAGLIISSLGSFAFPVLNRISDIGNKGRLTCRGHSKIREKFRKMLPLLFFFFLLACYIFLQVEKL